MPHVIEAASSGRAKCRACKTALPKGELRFGEAVPNPFGDGEATHWYHLRCAALRRAEAFLDALDLVDVQALQPPSDAAELQSLKEAAELGARYYRLQRFVQVHEAPSGRARCQGCRELIEKGALRFILQRIEDGMVSGAGFVHVACAHAYAGAVDGLIERVRPLSELSDEQWAEVSAQVDEQSKLERVERQPSGPA